MSDTVSLAWPWALEALRAAARATRAVQRTLSPAMTKADRSPVTAADFAAQAVVTAWLQKHDPMTPLVAEEDVATLRQAPESVQAMVLQAVRHVFPDATWEDIEGWLAQSRREAQPRMWVLDPVDGTKGFLRGAQYAVALARIEDGQVQWGGLACPNLAPEAVTGTREPTTLSDAGVLAVASRGSGAWWNRLDLAYPWQPLRTSPVQDPRYARLLRSFESSHTHEPLLAALVKALGMHRPPVRLDSQAKYVLLAAGAAEIYLRIPPPHHPDYKEKIWDQAAGALLVEEAGGRVTDLDGQPLDFGQGLTLARNRGVLATNGLLHDRVLQALQSLAEEG